MDTKESQPTVLAHGLVAGYGSGAKGRQVVADAEISLRKGDFAVMVGANGIGKSTLLRTLAGIQPRMGGQLLVDGKDPQTMSRHALARIVAMVFTERGGAGGLTVREFVSLGRQPHTGFFGRLGPDDREVVEQAMQRCSVSPLAGRFMAQVSDGERQKAMIARALAQETPLIILDEPTSFLDVAARIETLGTLSSLAVEMHRTVLLSTHDIAPALRSASRVITLSPEAQGAKARTYDIGDELLYTELDRIFAGRGVVFDRTAGDFRACL